MNNEILKRLLARMEAEKRERDRLMESRGAIVEIAKQELRDDLSDDEDAEFRDLTDKIKAQDEVISKLDERITQLADEEQRSENAAAAYKRSRVADLHLRVTEARTYEKGSGKSYFADLVRAHMLSDAESRGRLERHAQDVLNGPEYRDINRTDGTGGYFVPPAWLMDSWVALARASRATADLVTNLPLPSGTDSLNIPKVSTGTATAIQTADNAAVQETDMADTSVVAPVRTIAGQQDVSIQLLEQSPVNFDEIIFRDLAADYATKTDVQVLAGSGASGQVTGLTVVSGTNAITYTDATPTVGELYSKIADAIQQVHTGRFLAPTVIVMHPRRWAWMLAALDTAGRPLVVPNAQAPMNSAGLLTVVDSQTVVGSIQGLPVVTDPSITTTAGAGTEDKIIVMRASDLILWESAIRTRVLPDVGSGTLTVRLQVYGYLAFAADRYVKSISIIGGTGLIAPTF